MILSGIPYKFQYIWGSGASSGFVTNPVPATAVSAIAASQLLGFPPATAEPEGSGGTPPDIDDFNGMAYYLSAWAQWMQAGGPIQYDAAFAGNNNGYPKGALLASTTTGLYWVCTADNNLTDPDGGSPANWQSLFAGLATTSYVNATFAPKAAGDWINFKMAAFSNFGSSISINASTSFTPAFNGQVYLTANAGCNGNMLSLVLSGTGFTEESGSASNFGQTSVGVYTAILDVTAGAPVSITVTVTASVSGAIGVAGTIFYMPSS